MCTLLSLFLVKVEGKKSFRKRRGKYKKKKKLKEEWTDEENNSEDEVIGKIISESGSGK